MTDAVADVLLVAPDDDVVAVVASPSAMSKSSADWPDSRLDVSRLTILTSRMSSISPASCAARLVATLPLLECDALGCGDGTEVGQAATAKSDGVSTLMRWSCSVGIDADSAAAVDGYASILSSGSVHGGCAAPGIGEYGDIANAPLAPDMPKSCDA